MKYRRSGRLVDMTEYLLRHPHQSVSLTFFSEKYNSAKSSISEDIGIIKEVFEQKGIGRLATSAGVSGGVIFVPTIDDKEALDTVHSICEQLKDPSRLLPGGYLYMMDIIGDPERMQLMGRIFASYFKDAQVDVVMTMATKGIPLAYAVASHLNVPVSIVRHEQRVTEGSIVSINYVSGSSQRIQTMSLSKRSLQSGARVLIIDDFMKAGGTIRGMMDLSEEFQATVVGAGVLMEAMHDKEKLVDNYVSLTKLFGVDAKDKKIHVEKGNMFP
ncbi:pur operon repressor [Alkalicoccus daliensis]|uniref:Purine operon repressor, PurR n=1 Tax=Alkalicoccus daliensis TaxID=745820 RepID=A0A1H0KUP1_9BACI|nr:pur operon repressor [Alkalicoccus daliensis]SDO59506.1 purine operon repressor, PurR [Alkalicoccus daliensis]